MKRKTVPHNDAMDAFDVIMNKKKKCSVQSLKKIISGGQTGADRAALEAAYSLGIQTGGIVPLGFITSDGKCPELGSKFHLKQLDSIQFRGKSLSHMYIERSKMNVDQSDGTIAFRLYSSNGTDKTIGYCLTGKWTIVNVTKKYVQEKKSYHRPILIIDNLHDKSNEENIRDFIDRYQIGTLNVCGHREFTDHENLKNEKFSEYVKRIMINALKSTSK